MGEEEVADDPRHSSRRQGKPDLPLFVQQTLWVDMRHWEKADDDGFYRLVCGILGKAPGDSPMKRFGVRDVAEWQGAGSRP